jgi:hypothetical protein
MLRRFEARSLAPKERCTNRRRLAGMAGFVAIIGLVSALGLASRAAGRTEVGVASRAACQPADLRFTPARYKSALKIYSDPIKDAVNAPDFCADERVTNDTQVITIGMHFHNRAALKAGDSISIMLDTDLNQDTGEIGSGAEYEIALDSAGAQLKRWDGTAFVSTSATPLPMYWVRDYGPMLTLRRKLIGNPTGFNFVLVSSNGQSSDRAPNAGFWSYSLTPFALLMKSPSLGRARAGRPFSAAAVVMRSDFNIPLTQGSIRCAAKLAGRPLAGKGRFANKRVACTWILPRRARGRRLSGSISVTFQHVTGRRSVSIRVK